MNKICVETEGWWGDLPGATAQRFFPNLFTIRTLSRTDLLPRIVNIRPVFLVSQHCSPHAIRNSLRRTLLREKIIDLLEIAGQERGHEILRRNVYDRRKLGVGIFGS